VLVHRGSVTHGHYIAYLRPSSDPQWYEFDDHKVRKVSEQDAIENNYGGEEFGNTSSAYMLVYIKKIEIEKMLKPLTLDDLPAHLLERFSRERAAKEAIRKQEYEKHHFMIVGYCTEKEIREQSSSNLCENSNFKFVKAPRDQNRVYLKHLIAQDLDMHPDRLRLWEWCGRTNDTARANTRPCNEFEMTQFIGESMRLDKHDGLQRYFVEIGDVIGEHSVFFPNPEDKSLLFFKYYNPVEESLKYLGCRFYDFSTTISEIIPDWLKEMNLTSSDPIIAWEEVSMRTQEEIHHNTSIKMLKLGSGDIVVFQKKNIDLSLCKFPKLSDFFVNLSKTTTIRFKLLNSPLGDFDMKLSTSLKYIEIATKVAEKLNVQDPYFLRFKQPLMHNSKIKKSF